MNTYYQGYMDGLCGIYSILNADKIVNGTSDLESQATFNNIVEYLDYKGTLKDVILEGSDHTTMKRIIDSLETKDSKIFPLRITNKRGLIKLKDWWEFSKNFLEEGKNRTIILSLGGKVLHLTVVERMTKSLIYLRDSSWEWKTIKKSDCKIMGYPDTDKYIIYPSQCWYLGKE